jgi:hypothetical protein
MKLPDMKNIVSGDIRICSNESHLFGNSCCDKQTVKGIAMYHGQRFKNGKMRCRYGDNGNFVFFRKADKTFRFTGIELSVRVQLPKSYFNGKFPSGRYADVHVIGKVPNNTIGGLGQRFIAVEEPNSGVSVQQIAAHLHIILEVFKGRVKVICHAKLPIGAAKYAFLYPFHFCRSKGNYSPALRYFAGHFNGQPVVSRNFNRLFNGHGESIA